MRGIRRRSQPLVKSTSPARRDRRIEGIPPRSHVSPQTARAASSRSMASRSPWLEIRCGPLRSRSSELLSGACSPAASSSSSRTVSSGLGKRAKRRQRRRSILALHRATSRSSVLTAGSSTFSRRSRATSSSSKTSSLSSRFHTRLSNQRVDSSATSGCSNSRKPRRSRISARCRAAAAERR